MSDVTPPDPSILSDGGDVVPFTAARVVILDRCEEFGRLLALIVQEQRPEMPVRAFTDPAEARRWVTVAPGPVLVFADLEVGEQAAQRVARWSSRAGLVRLVLLADPDEGAVCSLATTPRPVRLEAWRACIGRALAPAGAWHTAGQWRTPPAPDASC